MGLDIIFRLQMRLLLAVMILFMACNQQEKAQQPPAGSNRTDRNQPPQSVAIPVSNRGPDTSDYATSYVLIADTGKLYADLDRLMYQLSKALHLPVDTMGRYYNAKEDEVIVPEDDSDEMYAGEYYPRRFTGENLSIEYLDVYQKNTTPKTLALVSGIFETAQQADSALRILQQERPGAYQLKPVLYVGCMH